METSKKQISLFTEDKSTSSQGDSPANHTHQQVNDLERKMTVTSGEKCLEQLERFNHVGSWAKTFVALLIRMEGWYSRRCKLTWKLKGTKYNRLYFRFLSVNAPHRRDRVWFVAYSNECNDGRNARENERTANLNGYKNGTKYGSLLSQVKYTECSQLPKQWKHQAARTHESQESKYKPSEHSNGQNDKGNATDSDSKLPQYRYNSRTSGGQPSRRTELNHLMSQETGKNSQLNPLFVEEMMGFPENWTLLPFLNGETNQSKPTETQ